MSRRDPEIPDNTAIRTALWRALHVEQDPPPHIFSDTIGLQLISPDEDWRDRQDMSPFTKPFRASIIARARFVEDLVIEHFSHGVSQYVILGAGLDTFAQRNPEIASQMNVFEVDQAETQEWKKRRLHDLNFGIPSYLRFVPVNFERADLDWTRLTASGFRRSDPAVISSMGLSMYLSREAVIRTLRQAATLATNSTFVMSFLLPIEHLEPDIRTGVERAAAGAKASGTPWLSFFTPREIASLALEAGFARAEHVSAEALAERYFAGRTDGLRPPKNSEELLIATT